METKLALNDETISQLQDLIRINIDSAEGFREAASELEDSILAEKFKAIAEQREKNALELQSYVEFNGEEPVKEGSYAAAVHRTWIKCRTYFTTSDTLAVLKEAEYGEDQIKYAYEDALKANPGSAMSDLLHQQFNAVKLDHDTIRDLRDSMKDGNCCK